MIKATDPRGLFVLIVFLALMPLEPHVHAAEINRNSFPDRLPPIELHAFFELRAGCRTQEDPHEKDISVMEARLQMELFTYTDWAEFKYKGGRVGRRSNGKGGI